MPTLRLRADRGQPSQLAGGASVRRAGTGEQGRQGRRALTLEGLVVYLVLQALTVLFLLPDYGNTLSGENVGFIGLVLGVALVAGGHSGWVASRGSWAAAAAAGLLAWAAAGLPRVPREVVAVALLAVTAVELGQARPAAEYHQLVPTAAYDDPGPVMERLGREGGRYVSIAWDAADTSDKRRALTATVPAGLPRGCAAAGGSAGRGGWPPSRQPACSPPDPGAAGLHQCQPGLPSQGIALIADRDLGGSPEVRSATGYSPADWTEPSARS